MKPHVILFALVIGYASASVAAPPSLVLPANTADVDDTTSAAIVLPYDLDPGWRVAQIDVGDVALGGRRDADLTAAVPSAIALDGTRLQLTVLRAKLRWAGSYQVVLRFTLVPVAPASGAGSGAAAPAPAAPASGSADPEAAEHRRGHDDAPVITSLAVTLNRVAPKLDAAAAVSIRITSQWWVFWSQQTITPLALAETSRRASFAQLAVRQRGVTVNDGAPTDVALTVTVIPPGPSGPPGPTAPTPPGADLPSQITVTGDVPLGTSSGTLVIDDDRLDAPVTVGFTIQRRRWSGLIFLVFLAGGLAGYAIRQRANKIAIQLKLREDGQAGLAALDMLIARSLPKERGLLIKARNAITDALDSTDETRIAPAIAAGNQAASAVADVHTKQLADRTALLASYAALPAMLAIRELAVDLSELPTAVDAINDALTDHDVAAAERGLAKLDARLEARRADLDAWTARLALALAALATKQLPKPIADVWTAPPLSTIRAAQPRSSAMLVVLEAVEPTVRELDTALTGAADALLRLAATATAALSNARAIAHRLADASAMIGGDLPARVDQLAAALAAWYATLHDELTAWKDRAATAADATTGLTALDGGDYGAAMAMLNQLSPPPPPPQSDAPVPRAEHLAPRAHVLAPRPPAAGDPIPTVSDVGGPTHAKLALLRLRRQSRMWTAVQVVFAYIVLPFGAWAGFHDAFVGTAAELIALGATGFVTDFTADAAIAKLQSLKG